MTTIQNCTKHPDQMTRSGCTGIISVTPSPGWYAEANDADGTECSQPLIGWGVQCNGEVVPLVADVDGSVVELSETSRCVYGGQAIGPQALDALEAIYMGLRDVATAVR